LILAVHPYLPAVVIIDRYTPLVRYLESETGQKIEIRIGKDYKEHTDHIGNDLVDIAFMGPASYVKMVNQYGKKPILARLEINGAPVFHGNIIVRDDSPIQTMDDLIGKSFAFGDPSSTMSYLVPLYMLNKSGIALHQLKFHEFLGSHNNVALGVLSGDYEAGAVKSEVFLKHKVRGLRSLKSTPELSEHLFITNSTMPPELVTNLQQAMYKLAGLPQGKRILNSIKKHTTGFVPASNSDYDNLREILMRPQSENP
jgi:phosphonate transport system substrate-binding protein